MKPEFRHRLGRHLLWSVAVSPLALGAGGIQTDGSVGANRDWLGKPQTLAGKEVTISQEMGSTAGRNLFHSFAEFNVNKGQTVTFTGDSALSNVISRVTGKSGSDIDGTLRSTVGKADFYLINPNGVTFGPGATVDVPAAFHVSTADEIRFKDGARFSASDQNGSSLSAAEPAAFGYLGTSSVTNGLIAPEPGVPPASIKVDGAQLEAKGGGALDIVAGEVGIKNGARLSAASGEIRLVATQGQREVSLDATTENRLSLPKDEATADNAGRVTIKDSSLRVSGDGAGRVGIYGNEVELNASELTAHNTGSSKANVENGIHIRAGSLKMDSALLGADAEGLGKGADISIETTVNAANGGIVPSQFSAGRISQSGGAIATRSFKNAGDAGSIRIAAGGDLELTGGARVSSTTESSKGAAGSVEVSGRRVELASSVLESASVGDESSGKTGDVLVNAKESISIDQGAKLSIANQAKDKPPLTFEPSLLSLSAPEIEIRDATISTDTDGAFVAAKIQLAGNSIALKAGAQLTSSSQGEGDAGLIGIEGDDLLLDRAEIRAEALRGAKGGIGGIRLKSGNSLSLLNGSTLSLENNAIERPDPGGIIGVIPGVIDVESVFGPVFLRGSTLTTQSTGGVAAGQILVTAPDRIELVENSTINTSALGFGQSGRIEINSSSGQIAIDHSRVLAESSGRGSGGKTGDVILSAKDSIRLTDVTVSTTNEGVVTDAQPKPEEIGSVSIAASDIRLDHANLLAATSGDVRGGSIKVNASGNLGLARQSVISVATSGTGPAGSVDVRGQNIDIDGSVVSAAATNPASGALSGGRTGSVTVSADHSLRLANGGTISATNQGVAANPESVESGQIQVSAADVTLDKGNVLASTSGNVDGGSISVIAGNTFAMTQASLIAASTSGAGAAGSVKVSAKQISIDDAAIAAESTGTSSSGMTGSVTVVGSETLRLNNGGRISIANEGVAAQPNAVSPTSLRVTAPDIRLARGTILATTSGNVAGGIIDVTSSGDLQLAGQSAISAATTGAGAAGSVTVQAARIGIDNSEISAASQGAASSGQTGNVRVTAIERLDLRNLGTISIANQGVAAAPAGVPGSRLLVSAPSLTLDSSSITATSSGNVDAGSISINDFRSLALIGNSAITSSTAGAGGAGTVEVIGGRIDIDHSSISAEAIGQGSSGRTGNVNVAASDRIDVHNVGSISIANQGLAPRPTEVTPGRLTVAAPTIRLNHGTISAKTSGNVTGGTIDLAISGDLQLDGKSAITAATTGSGAAGALTVQATRIDIDNAEISAASQGAASSGQTGNVRVTAIERLDLRNLGTISIANQGVAAAPAGVPGSGLLVSAPSLNLDTGSITATSSGNVAAGSIGVEAAQALSMTRDSSISSSTTGAGGAGAVEVRGGEINIDHSDISAASIGSGSSGRTGNVSVVADTALGVHNLGSISIANDGVAADPAAVTPGRLTLVAPKIDVSQGQVLATTSGNVAGGSLNIQAGKTLVLSRGSTVSASTAGAGAGGEVRIDAGRSITARGSSVIAASTRGSGDAGSVVISTSRFLADNSVVTAQATARVAGQRERAEAPTSARINAAGSAFAPARTATPPVGQPGSIRLNARDSLTLIGKSSINIDDRARGNESGSHRSGNIRIDTPELSLNDSSISTRSAGNRDAGGIELHVPDRLTMVERSSVTTSARTGNGGSISILGPDLIRLADSQIKSSVDAGDGNGGAIAIEANMMLLQTGLIEANAFSGNGGDVTLNVETLLASGNGVNGRDAGSDFLSAGKSAGNWSPGQFGNNIIRAVSQDGVSGNIQFSAPQLNLSGVIANLGLPLFGAVEVTPDACRKEPGSTLTVEGHGGLPSRLRDWMLY